MTTTPVSQSDGIQTSFRVEIADEGPRAWVERSVTIPGSAEPYVFGVRPAFAHHYGVESEDYPSRPTTNDVFAAAVASCMTGTFLGTLELRGLTLASKQIDAITEVDMGRDAELGVDVIRAIRMRFVVRVAEDERALVTRVHGFYDKACWLSQTLIGSRCTVESELVFE
jgi:organic hydroperoxide reductase OsmC/OhrA